MMNRLSPQGLPSTGEVAFGLDDRENHLLKWLAEQGGMWHQAGNLHIDVLKRMAHHAKRVKARATAETGCGLSTVLMSAIVDRHLCFTVADGNPLQRVQNAEMLRQEAVTFIIGPAQMTLPRYSFPTSLDFALIDGPHAFPYPQLEYFYFYQQIRPGGVLVIDDIHIPTIRQMYDFLREDKMWEHIEDVENTAFFQRTTSDLQDPLGDGWQHQKFNQRHFANHEQMDGWCPGWRDHLSPNKHPILGQC